jgi:hypothetical protein
VLDKVVRSLSSQPSQRTRVAVGVLTVSVTELGIRMALLSCCMHGLNGLTYWLPARS